MLKKCKHTWIKTKKNFPHGRKSKPVIRTFCKICGKPIRRIK